MGAHCEECRHCVYTNCRHSAPCHTTVRLKKGEANLPKACTALAHQVTTIDRSKLIVPKVGTLSKQPLLEIQRALAAYLAFDELRS